MWKIIQILTHARVCVPASTRNNGTRCDDIHGSTCCYNILHTYTLIYYIYIFYIYTFYYTFFIYILF